MLLASSKPSIVVAPQSCHPRVADVLMNDGSGLTIALRRWRVVDAAHPAHLVIEDMSGHSLAKS